MTVTDKHHENPVNTNAANAGSSGKQSTQLPAVPALQKAETDTGATLWQGAQQTGEAVIQGVFTFLVNTNTYSIYNTRYDRVQGSKYMTGNKEYKHVTADSLKDSLWTGMEGMTLTAFSRRLMHISETYLALPGLELMETHKLFDEDNLIYEGINQAIVDNSAAFDTVMELLPRLSSELGTQIQNFEIGSMQGNSDKKNAAAFFMQNKAAELIQTMDKFRDMMPLVNIVSGIQNGGQEREAKAFLKDGTTSKNIANNLDALWAFFDFAAIDEMKGDNLVETKQQIRDALPWINMKALVNLAAEKTALADGVEPHEVNIDIDDVLNIMAVMMLQNHINLVKLSYPDVAKACNFDSVESIHGALTKHEVSVDRNYVATHAFAGW